MTNRNTKTKMCITTLFESSGMPMLTNDVFAAVKKNYPQTAYSTVYRIIQSLLHQGLIVAVDWKERGSRYEWAGSNHHHHLVCSTCGTVTDIGDEVLEFKTDKITQKTGFAVKDHSIEIFGVCSPCQRSH